MKEVEVPLTVVIPTFDGKELLRRCLGSLRGQSRVPRVIVVDDASRDGTPAMLREEFPEVRCLRLPQNQGFAKAANAGLAAAGTPYVALLNNDTEADPRWVEAGLEAFQRYPGCGFFASRMVNDLFRDRLDSAGDCYNKKGMPYKRGWGEPCREYNESVPILGASAGAAFYRREMFRSVGYLDESFHMYLEDVELSLRAQTRGFRCRYLPAAIVYHVEAASDPDRNPDDAAPASPRVFQSPRRVFWISRNRWLLMVLYQPSHNLPWLALGWIKSLLYHALKAGHTAPFLKGVWAGVRATPQAWEKRREIRRRQTISHKELCQLLQRC